MRKATGQRIVQAFFDRYEDKHGKKYLVNYPMIATAEKLASFYSMSEVEKALDYYFKTYEGDIYDFLSNINKYIRNQNEEQKAILEFNKLTKQTMAQVKKIHRKRPGRKS